MQLSDKIRNVLASEYWYHATTMENYYNILANGVIASHNLQHELDFGAGFYLCQTADAAERYIARLSYPDDVQCVIMRFRFVPLIWFDDDSYNTAVFAAYNDEFAEFVFKNRLNPASLQHKYDAIYGVMSDSFPTMLLAEYRTGELTRDAVIEGLKKSTSAKQLSLHNQLLCDRISLCSSYLYDYHSNTREELNIHERENAAVC